MNIKIESGYLVISDEDRSILKTEFDKLNTIDEKYKFWHDKFHLNYSLNRKDNIQEHTFSEFLIIPEMEIEIEEFNKRVYNDYLNSITYFKEKTEIAKWKETFEIEIEQANDKEDFIAFEIRKIDEYVSGRKNKMRRSRRGLIKAPDIHFVESYENYMKFKQELDWGEKIIGPYDIHDRLAGIETAKFRLFLKNFLKNKKPRKQGQVQLTGEQKFLILHYLGFGDAVKANTKKSVLYGLFLELTENTIRPMFSDIKRYETEENLNQIIDFFRLIKLTSEARYIQQKLDKLNKKR